MDRTTNDYILYLKKHGDVLNIFGDYYLDATAKFLSDVTDNSIEIYNKSMIFNYIQGCFKDFMSTCEQPRLVVYDFLESFNKQVTDKDTALAHSLCVALDLVQVREKWNGIWKVLNGFYVSADPKDDEYLKEKEN